jgi:hypothetical protein
MPVPQPVKVEIPHQNQPKLVNNPACGLVREERSAPSDTFIYPDYHPAFLLMLTRAFGGFLDSF